MAYSPWVCRELNTTLLLRAGFLYSFSERGLLFVVVHRLLIAAASLVAQLVKNPPAMQETQVRFLGQEDPPTGEGIGYPLQYSWASLVAQLVKNLHAIRETWV